MASRWCRIVSVNYEYNATSRPMYSDDYGYAGRVAGREFVTIDLKLEASPDTARYFQTVGNNDIDLANLQANIGLQRRPDQVGGVKIVACPKCVAREASGTGRLSIAGSSLVEAVARAAGVDAGKVSLEELVEAIERLRVAASPPFVPTIAVMTPYCHRCGAKTVVRRARQSGAQFTACTAWPQCTWTWDTDPDVRAGRIKPSGPQPETAKGPAYATRKLEIDE